MKFFDNEYLGVQKFPKKKKSDEYQPKEKKRKKDKDFSKEREKKRNYCFE